MDMDKVVCFCMGVTNGDVKAAVDAGASTLEEVQTETGAATVCGACMENVQRLVDFFVKERDNAS
jgi:NAD(P)H-nitrite reductase large subunit